MAESEYRRLSCRDCGVDFSQEIRRGRPRLSCHGCAPANAAPQPTAKITASCEQCGEQMAPEVPSRVKRFCSRTCLGKSQRKHAETACAECGKAFRRRPGGDERRNGREPKYCSVRCAGAVASRMMAGTIRPLPAKVVQRNHAKRMAREAARDIDRQSKERSKQERMAAEYAARAARTCNGCGKPLGLHPFNTWCCTKACSDDIRRRWRRATKHRYRAKLRAATVERFLDVEIFRRDGWRCQICGAATPEKWMGKNLDRAPTLDHITAIARGGAHSRANVQCACRACNSLKSDGPPRGQVGLWAIGGRGVKDQSNTNP